MGAEHTRLRETIQKLTGLKIEEDKIYLIETRLSDLMKEYEIPTFNEMARMLETASDQRFIDRVIEKITTHETRFFRDESIFDAFVMQIIPEWIERKGLTRSNLGGTKLEIWSAGCSTGQEPYSISMILHEKFPEVVRNATIRATDISRETIERAQKGIYTKFEVDRGLPEVLMDRYFEKQGDVFQLHEKIRSSVQFSTHNLTTTPFGGPYDIIFFRNVAIYFSEEERVKLYNKMKSALKKDGSLILGSAESLSGYLTDYIVREHGLARYYELNASLVTIFR